MKRLSNKKYMWTYVLWGVVIVWILWFGAIMLATTSKGAEPEPVPFCQMWNDPPEKGFTPNQLKMFHMGYFLTKEDLVRTTLNQHYGGGLLVDLAVTCYTEHIVFLVEEVDGVCKCSTEDRAEQVGAAWNDYINACVREANRQVKEK